jgi:hypothetical protein
MDVDDRKVTRFVLHGHEHRQSLYTHQLNRNGWLQTSFRNGRDRVFFLQSASVG